MNLFEILRGILSMKLRVVLVAALSVVGSVLITYRPSISPLRLTPRVAAFGVAQSQLLVDSKDSPLADSQVLTDDIDLLAANLAEVGDSPAILNRVAASVGVSPSKVAVSEQLVQNVAFSQSDSQEAQVGNQIIGDARHYALLLRVDPQSFVIQIFTQAPAGAQAIRMANATATAISRYVANLVTTERVPPRRQIIMRQVVGAYGGDVDTSLTLAVTILLAVAFFVLGLIILFWIRRHRQRPLVPDRQPLDPVPAPVIDVSAATIRWPPSKASRDSDGLPPSQTSRGSDGLPPSKASRGSDDWPHTRRVMPWLIALLLALIYLVPIDSVFLPIQLPIDSELDRFVLGAIFLIWLAFALCGDSRPRFRHSPMNFSILIFVVVCVLSIAFNLRSLAWDGELTLSIKELSLLVSYLALFYICATSIRASEVMAFAKVLVVLACLTAIGTIYEYRVGANPFFDIAKVIFGASHVSGLSTVAVAAQNAAVGARPLVTGPTAHGLADATIMAAAFPLSLSFAAASKRRWEVIRWLVATALLIGGCIATGRKTALLVPLVSLLVLVAYQPRRYLRFWPVAILGFALVELLVPHAISRLVVQLTTASSSSSTATRLSDYPAVVPFVFSHLLLGRGYGSFDPFKYRILDNQMLGWLVEIGVVGALAYAGVMAGAIVSVARVARRGVGPAKRLMQSVVAVSVGFFVSNFLYDTFGFRQAPYIFFFVAALGVACVSDPAVPQSVGKTAELTAPTRVYARRRFFGQRSPRGV